MSVKTRPFDPSEDLGSDEAVAAYLTSILEENDPALLAAALGDVARARGMTEIARAAGLPPGTHHQALRPLEDLQFHTVQRLCTALGVRLIVQPMDS